MFMSDTSTPLPSEPKLVVAIYLPDEPVDAGDVFELSLIISHGPESSADAYNLNILLEELHSFIIAPDNFSIVFADGQSDVYGR